MTDGVRLVDRVEATGGRGMVAAKNVVASRAGARMFELGGNAVDAAIAAAFASGVVEPMMSGLGGGGVMIVHDPTDGRSWCVDFGMRSPALATPGLLRVGRGPQRRCLQVAQGRRRRQPDRPPGGGRAGRRRRLRRRAPALGPPAVEDGDPAGHRGSGRGRLGDAVPQRPGAERVGEAAPLPGRRRDLPRRGRPAAAARHHRVGARLVQPDLARTLARSRADGAAGFYGAISPTRSTPR